MNRIKNPTFEGVYQIQGANEIKVAPEWTAVWLEDCPASAPDAPQGLVDYCKKPEYDPATMLEDPRRVYSGDRSQKVFSMWKVMEAYLFQRVQVPAGVVVKGSMVVQSWASNLDNPRVSDEEFYFRIGIDPLGDTDPTASWVVWGEWARGTADWQELELELKTTGPQVTVFVGAWCKFRHKHGDAYFGMATLDVPEDGGTPPQGDVVGREELAGLLEDMAAKLRGGSNG